MNACFQIGGALLDLVFLIVAGNLFLNTEVADALKDQAEKLYKKGSIKDSSYDAIEKTVRNHIIPALGMIQLQKLTADDIQLMISDMKEK